MALRGLNACSRVILTDALRVSSLRGALQSDCLKCRHGAKRHLLSEDVVKLQEFQYQKLHVAHRVSQPKDYYFADVNQKLKKNKLILKAELKVLLHLCQCAEDVIIARNVIKRYHEENSNIEFREYKFGPLFMRLCYELGLEELAATTLTDPALKGFFSDSTSFNIAIDMLFNKQSYESGLEVLLEMKKQGVSFSQDTFMLAFATCYKMNTPKSYQICLTLLEEGQTDGSLIPHHAYCFATAFALKQNDIKRAQTLYSHIMDTNSQLCQNLRVLLLVMKGSVGETISALTSAQDTKTPVMVKKQQFSREVVDVLRSKSAGIWEEKVEQMVRELENAGQITEQTLDDFLCHSPSKKRRPMERLKNQGKIHKKTLKALHSGLLLE